MKQQAPRSSPSTLLKRAVALAIALLTMMASMQMSAALAADPMPNLVKNIEIDDSVSMEGSFPNFLTAIGETMYFTANVSGLGRELWKSDGTSDGTVLVRDIFPGVGDGPFSPLEGNALTVMGNTLYFAADDGVSGTELWKSGGTSETTERVKDIRDGSQSSSPTNLVVVDGALFFSANDGFSGSELWMSDGTSGGTQLVANINAGISGSSPSSLTVIGNKLFFTADDGLTGRELWLSDATSATTVRLKDIRSGTDEDGDPNSSGIGSLTVVGDSIFFKANDGANVGEHGAELWMSDGTDVGTVLVKDLNEGPVGSNPNELLAFGDDKVFFRAAASSLGATLGAELWMSDGTAAGTVLVKDIVTGSTGSLPNGLIAFGRMFFFRAQASSLGVWSGEELWISDGTESGTVLVKDINPGNDSSSLRNFTIFNNKLYFKANDGTHQTELWESDGTPLGTKLVFDINASGNSEPSNLGSTRDTLFFAANSGPIGFELWSLSSIPIPDSQGSSGGSFNETPAVTPTPTPTPTAPVVAEPSATSAVRFSRFVPDSGKLPVLAAKGIAQTLSGYSTIDRVVCTGFTSGVKATALGRKVALQRAKNACSVAKRLAPKALIQVRVNVASGVGQKFRSVQLSITGN